MSSASKVKTTNQQDWVHVQRAKERQQDKSNGEEIIECPRSQDVVVRKGQRYRNNPGNLRYRALIERLADKHQAADKAEKYEITLRIVQEIEGSDGRFLDWTRKMWIVSKDRNKNRNKVASAIKQYNRQRTATQQLNQLKTTVQEADIILRVPGDNCNEAKMEAHKREVVVFPDLNRSVFDQRFAKRQKCEGCFGANDSDQSCFGKSFFPVPSRS